MMRVLLADDHRAVRAALRLLLEQEDIAVDGEVGDVPALLQAARSRCPDLVLLDWTMLDLPPRDLFQNLRSLCPHLQIVVLSGRPEARLQALSAGADIFISKIDPPDTVLRVLSALPRRA
jgi:two-component system response regulator EvgA